MQAQILHQTANDLIEIRPQPGPQSQFNACRADIAIYGGAAGGGKTFGLLLEDFRNYKNPLFGSVTFRRNTTQVRNEGGLWDESMRLFPLVGAKPRVDLLEWRFPSGSRVKFAHLEHEQTVLDWQGAQIPLIKFDELTHFTKSQFFYMLSRNRSMSGVPGYIRATCNPDPDSWVRQFIDYWIGPDGLPIPERAGKIRYFIRLNDEIFWGDTREELIQRFGPDELPKSVTFIPSNVYDNKILLRKDPSYLANLKALNRVDRLRLLGGNWNVRAAAGMYFQRGWFSTLAAVPQGFNRVIRYWDRAATKPSESNPDPDWTVGLLLYGYPNGTWLVGDIRRYRETPLQIERIIRNTAEFDGVKVTVYLEQDPGSAGVADVSNLIRLLAGFDVRVTKPTKDKETRAKPASAQAEAGNIFVLKAPWNDAFFTELENFPEGGHDDQVDALSGAFNESTQALSSFDTM